MCLHIGRLFLLFFIDLRKLLISQACELFDCFKLEALVLDFELSGRNGLEQIAAIKEKHPKLPVIFFTGQGNEEITRQAIKEGATDYLVKRTSDFAQ